MMTDSQYNWRAVPQPKVRDLALLVTKLAGPVTSAIVAPYIGVPWALAEIVGWWTGLVARSKEGLAKSTFEVVAGQVRAINDEPSLYATVRERQYGSPMPGGLVNVVENRASQLLNTGEVNTREIGQLRAVLELQISRRASQIAQSPTAGSDFDNWVQARRELEIANKATQISRLETAGSDFENWVRAEREIFTVELAERLAGARASGDVDNWITAERQFDLAMDARNLLTSGWADSDVDHWIPIYCFPDAAERARRLAAQIPQDLTVYHYVDILMYVAVQWRARAISRGGRGTSNSENWSRAELAVREAFEENIQSIFQSRIRDRASRLSETNSNSDIENWLKAETEVLVEQKCAILMNWKEADSSIRAARLYVFRHTAEHRLRVGIRAAEIARSAQAGTDQENWLQAERDLQQTWMPTPIPPVDG
jgi:hypothetical protein